MPISDWVVTAERWEKGLSYEDYFAQIQNATNKERFQRVYEEFQVKPEDAQFFADYVQKRGPIRVLALGEDWCPDVVRGFPVMARLAEASGIELRIFPRDVNLDIMNEYLFKRRHQSIPAFVFLNKEFQELGHWIERPALAYKEQAEMREELTNAEMSEEERRTQLRQRRERADPIWRQEIVRELREILYRNM